MTAGPPKIQAVIFDFGGVICFPPSDAQWQEAAAFCGANRTEFEAAFWKDREGYDAGEDPRVYWKNVGASLGIPFNEVLIDALIAREIEFWSRFDDRVLSWIGDLGAAGYRTGILSNCPRPIGEALKVSPGFLGNFDDVTFSYELGVVKPDATIYHRAIEGLGIDPGAALFLDDRESNVDGARAAGLQAEIFTTWQDFLTHDLHRYRLPAPAL